MMKVICAIIISVFIIPLRSQPSAGIVFAYTASEFKKTTENSAIRFKSLHGFSIGALFDIPVIKTFSLQCELKHANMGSRVESFSGGSGQAAVTTISMKYLTGNLNLIYHLGKKDIRLIIAIGPSYSIGLGKVNVNWKWLNNYNENIAHSSFPLDKFDFGLEYAGGLEWIGKKQRFFLELRGYSGLNELNYRQQWINVFEGSIIRNRSIGLRFGILRMLN